LCRRAINIGFAGKIYYFLEKKIGFLKKIKKKAAFATIFFAN